MNTKFKSTIRDKCQPFGAPVCAGAFLLMVASTPAQNLFVANQGSTSGTTVSEITPGGVQSTFATGLDEPEGLAFDSSGNLFEADWGSSSIYKFTPGGVRSAFASGLNQPEGLAFNSAGDLFVAEFYSGNVIEIKPNGVQSTFASGLNNPWALAFQGVTFPVPEPSAFGLLAGGGAILWSVAASRRRISVPPQRRDWLPSTAGGAKNVFFRLKQ